MKENKIKTIWNGKVALHQKYVKKALENREGLFMVYTGNQRQYLNNQMYIPPENLDVGKTGEELYPERHGKGFYKLVYFTWKNCGLQDKLF